MRVTCVSPVCQLHVTCVSPACRLRVTRVSPAYHLRVTSVSLACQLCVTRVSPTCVITCYPRPRVICVSLACHSFVTSMLFACFQRVSSVKGDIFQIDKRILVFCWLSHSNRSEQKIVLFTCYALTHLCNAYPTNWPVHPLPLSARV